MIQYLAYSGGKGFGKTRRLRERFGYGLDTREGQRDAFVDQLRYFHSNGNEWVRQSWLDSQFSALGWDVGAFLYYDGMDFGGGPIAIWKGVFIERRKGMGVVEFRILRDES